MYLIELKSVENIFLGMLNLENAFLEIFMNERKVNKLLYKLNSKKWI